MKMKASGLKRSKEGIFLVFTRSLHLSLVVFIIVLLIRNANLSKKTNLTGRHFDFVIFHQPPFDILKRGPNGTYTWTGSDRYLIEWLAPKLNFTYSLVLINQTIADKYGTHEGLYYQLINEEAIDGIASSFYLTMDRVTRMDYTFPTWADGFSLVVPRPGEENRLFAFVGPFQPTVWLLIFISIFVLVSVMTLFTWIHQRNVKNSLSPSTIDTESNNQPKGNEEVRNISLQRSLFTSFGSHMIYVMNIMTNQGGREVFSYLSFRIMVGIWVLCATVLVNSYTGIVISSLTTPRMKPAINSFEDLAASKEVSIILRHDTAIGEQILKATSGVYKILGDQARSNPGHILGDPLKLNAMLENGRYAYPFLSKFAYSFVGSQYKKEGKCRFKTSKTLSAMIGYYSLLFKKGSSHTPMFSRAYSCGHV
ncbi:glutamate receptor ionotropic, kainate 3 isoform X2 [Daphnia magna]|uniref:glutamate receptor ionotropic, kainate 3 isoform X2 n=1 Tax=Daphnia magna TaxID=35525 RepID=UPI001E1BD4E7|nr:glutamate receptor ionotropic, kainate 3 isoform X2 [Daphnia magna]